MNHIILFGILSISVICDGSCLTGTRRVHLADGSEDCVFCKECPIGHVVARACSDHRDTVCCPLNTYLPPTEMKQRCTHCSVCLAGQYMRRQCSLTEDAECSDCPNGTFTNVSNSFTCNNCTEECEHGVQVNCSRFSDTKCKDNRPGEKIDSAVIIAICTVLIVLLLSVIITVCITMYCRRKRTSEQIENERVSKHGETGFSLMSSDRHKEFEEKQSECISLSITTADVGGDTLVIDVHGETEGKIVETMPQKELHFKDSRVQRMNVNVDKGTIKLDTSKKSVSTNNIEENTPASEPCKSSSIGILYDTIAGRRWAVFVVGERSVMTSIEAYACMQAAREEKFESPIRNAHVTFKSFPLGFKISASELFIDDKLGVVIMNLLDFKSSIPLKFVTSPLNHDDEYQIYAPMDDTEIQRIDAKLDRMDGDKMSSMKKFLQKSEPTISKMRDNFRKVLTIGDNCGSLKADIQDKNISKYKDSHCFIGRTGRVLLGSPVCVKNPGQEAIVVGVCTRTIPWVFNLLDNHEYDLLKDHSYIICTPVSDILPIISNIKSKNV